MNNKLTNLFPFVFVFVLALDGHAKTPTINTVFDIVQNLEEYYVPSTPAAFKKIKIKNFKRSQYMISFKTTTSPVRIDWDQSGTFIKINGVKLSKKTIIHSPKLISELNRILGQNNRRFSFYSLFIPQAQAMQNQLSHIMSLFLRYLMVRMTTINSYQQPQRLYSQPANYQKKSVFSETTQTGFNNNLNFQNSFQPTISRNQFTPTPQMRVPTTTSPSTNCPTGYDAAECKVVQLTNAHRRRHGKQPLTVGQKCTALAKSHAQDMKQSGFFSHTSPNNGSFQTRSRRFGLRGGGENIASGQKSPESVMNAWIKSSGHNQNLLRSSFTKIGVSRVGNEWVQCFSR